MSKLFFSSIIAILIILGFYCVYLQQQANYEKCDIFFRDRVLSGIPITTMPKDLTPEMCQNAYSWVNKKMLIQIIVIALMFIFIIALILGIFYQTGRAIVRS